MKTVYDAVILSRFPLVQPNFTGISGSFLTMKPVRSLPNCVRACFSKLCKVCRQNWRCYNRWGRHVELRICWVVLRFVFNDLLNCKSASEFEWLHFHRLAGSFLAFLIASLIQQPLNNTRFHGTVTTFVIAGSSKSHVYHLLFLTNTRMLFYSIDRPRIPLGTYFYGLCCMSRSFA